MSILTKTTRARTLILGHGRHGKDTVAKLISEAGGGSFCSSSRFASVLFVWQAMVARGHNYASADECYLDRHNHRGLWHDLIAAYNTPDPTRLARELLEVNDMYVGMRSWREVYACIDAQLFDRIVWVDASRRLPLEGPNSMFISLDFLVYADRGDCPLIIVDNNNEAPVVRAPHGGKAHD